MSRTKKLKVLNPLKRGHLISEDIFLLDLTLDNSTRLKSSCSNKNECISLVYLYETVVIGMYLELNYYAVSVRRYQLDDFVIQCCIIFHYQSGKWKKLEMRPIHISLLFRSVGLSNLQNRGHFGKF